MLTRAVLFTTFIIRIAATITAEWLYAAIKDVEGFLKELTTLMEIRFHGRGGQGAVTGVRLLSTAMYYEGKYTLGIPMYGTERRGAPVQSFLRISDDRIYERDLVHEPDMVVVLDPLLAKTVPVTQGTQERRARPRQPPTWWPRDWHRWSIQGRHGRRDEGRDGDHRKANH